MHRAHPTQLQRVISGGQTGVDRAALDAAMAMEIEHGGWCPRGRLAEDGRIADRYELQETTSPEYPVRTERNVVMSDATLILARGELQGGTELTRKLAERHAKPLLVLDLDATVNLAVVASWLQDRSVTVLNVAGPRESSDPGIERAAYDLLIRLFSGGDSPDPEAAP